MLGVSLLLLLVALLGAECSSCFQQAPWSTIRPVLQFVYPCSTIDDCESNCLDRSECSAYAFVNGNCALLGADSGKPEMCTSANPTLWLRTAACDATTTSTQPTTTLTTTSSTTTLAPCSPLVYEAPSTCPGQCSSPSFGTSIT